MLQETYSYILLFYMLNSFCVQKAWIKQIKFLKIKKNKCNGLHDLKEQTCTFSPATVFSALSVTIQEKENLRIFITNVKEDIRLFFHNFFLQPISRMLVNLSLYNHNSLCKTLPLLIALFLALSIVLRMAYVFLFQTWGHFLISFVTLVLNSMMRECLNDKKAISTLNKCLEVYGGGAGRMGTCMWITILKMERGNPKEMEARVLKVDAITLTFLQPEESFFISPALGLPWWLSSRESTCQ